MNKAKLGRATVWLRGPAGALPDFVILGGQKCGTGSLFDLITSSENVRKPACKEVLFFDRYFHKGINWYKAHFPRKTELEENNLMTGEATPGYIYNLDAPRRAKEVLPDHTKFIVLFRNPVDRAYSHYKHEVRKGVEKLSFEEALQAEPARLEKGMENYMKNPRKLHDLRHYSYTDRGMYARQLKHWYSFFPKERFLVIRTEDLYEKPREISDQLASFLELPDLKDKAIPKSNVGNYKDPISPELRNQLGEKFRQPNAELGELLGRDMNWDKQS